jgi:hypothetical protein
MTRVALYACYSSDNQRGSLDRGPAPYLSEQAKRESWQVVGAYKNAGISGSSMILRPMRRCLNSVATSA